MKIKDIIYTNMYKNRTPVIIYGYAQDRTEFTLLHKNRFNDYRDVPQVLLNETVFAWRIRENVIEISYIK
ncbi:MAG: hypothetical protein J6A63_00170 [Clostridia bacterium]|nr:hypothetical protein [Clostridia bacterium]